MSGGLLLLNPIHEGVEHTVAVDLGDRLRWQVLVEGLLGNALRALGAGDVDGGDLALGLGVGDRLLGRSFADTKVRKGCNAEALVASREGRGTPGSSSRRELGRPPPWSARPCSSPTLAPTRSRSRPRCSARREDLRRRLTTPPARR